MTAAEDDAGAAVEAAPSVAAVAGLLEDDALAAVAAGAGAVVLFCAAAFAAAAARLALAASCVAAINADCLSSTGWSAHEPMRGDERARVELIAEGRGERREGLHRSSQRSKQSDRSRS